MVQHDAGGGAQGPAHFLGNDIGDSGFAHARRPVEDAVVQGFSPLLGGFHTDTQRLLHPRLTHILVEALGPQRRFEAPFVIALLHRDDPVVHGHFASSLRAARMRSCKGISPLRAASTCFNTSLTSAALYPRLTRADRASSMSRLGGWMPLVGKVSANSEIFSILSL